MAAAWPTRVKKHRLGLSNRRYSPSTGVACSLIIHVFCSRVDFSATATAIFCQAVVFFAFFGLSITLLRLSEGFQATGRAAGIGAVRLSAPAPPAHAKYGAAPPAPDQDQLRDSALKIAGV